MTAAPDGYGDGDVERIGGVKDDDPRSPFARDYDRLIYTRAFRRLQGKTQVVSPGEGDLFRTRLTHTIEVAQAARRLAEELNRRADVARAAAGRPPGWVPSAQDISGLAVEQQKIDPDLCEAAAVLHDLGHPPFGHAGEVALHAALQKYTSTPEPLWKDGSPAGFNGNAQSFRLAAWTLKHRENQHGLQLTRAALDASLKYPWRYADSSRDGSSDKWNVDAPMVAVFEQVRSDVPPELRYEQTVEAQVMDWADDMAYATNDADDWFRAGYMPLARLVTDQTFRENYVQEIAAKWVTSRKLIGYEATATRDRIRGLADGFFTSDTGPCVLFDDPELPLVWDPTSADAARAFKYLRGWVFNRAFTGVKLVARAGIPAETPRRYALQLDVPEGVRVHNDVLKRLLWQFVVGDHRMATLQAGQQRVVSDLIRTHADAVISGNDRLLPAGHRKRLENADDADERLRIVVDYVSGMTDEYALARHSRIFTGTGRLHELPS